MAITNGLVTLVDYQNFVGNTPQTSARQDMIEDAITTASRWVESYTGRQFHKSDTSGSPVATARYFDTDDGACLNFDDVYSSTGFLVAVDSSNDGTYATTITDYQLSPVGGYDPILGACAYTRLRGSLWTALPQYVTWKREGLVRITALWGWASVPDVVQRATLTLAQDIVRDPEARFGGLTVTDVGILGRSTNPRVTQLLGPFVRFERTAGIA